MKWMKLCGQKELNLGVVDRHSFGSCVAVQKNLFLASVLQNH